MKENYDVVLVGGGIANILCALRLANTDKSVCLIEKGNDITKRVCPKIKTGKCEILPVRLIPVSDRSHSA